MKKIQIITSTVCICILSQAALATMLQYPSQTNAKDKFLLQLNSEKLNERYGALYYFSKFSREELGQDISNKILDMFKDAIKASEAFNEYASKPGKLEDKVPPELLYVNSEEFGQYYSLLGYIVGKTQDVSILPLLIEHHFHPELVADFGEIAVDPVIQALKTESNDIRRSLAIHCLKNMLNKDKNEGYIAQGRTRDKIKATLIEYALYEKEYSIRRNAVVALVQAGDADLIPVLEKIAANDPFHLVEGWRMPTDREPPPGKKVLGYPIRELARKELERLKQNPKK